MDEGLKDARRAAIGSYECRCGGRERDIMVHWVRMVGRLAVAKTQKEAVATSHWCDWNSLIPIVASDFAATATRLHLLPRKPKQVKQS